MARCAVVRATSQVSTISDSVWIRDPLGYSPDSIRLRMISAIWRYGGIGLLARRDRGPATGAAVTFAGMGERDQVRAGHAAYIGVVLRCLRERGVSVAATSTGCSHGLRNAELHLQPDAAAFATPVPEQAFLAWDEENGWSLGIRRDPATLAVLNRVYKGLSVLPDPEDVALWVVVLLAHTELTPSREDHPFRDHAVEDHEFEAQLARYAPGG